MLAAGLATALVFAASAPAAQLELGEESAAPGQVVAMTGPGVTEPGVQVAVGGKPASVLKPRRGKGRFVVPNVEPGRRSVVVKTGDGKLTGSLEVTRGSSFKGRVKPKLDTARRKRRTIGPGGGTVTAKGADGSKFKLVVPAGALGAPVAITATPVKRLGNAPLKSRKKIEAVQFGPNGLVFAKPAKLTIVPAHGVPRHPAAFVYDGSGKNLTFQAVKRSGDGLVVKVRHFSGIGEAPTSVDDFLLQVGYIVRKALANEVITQYDIEFFISALKLFTPAPDDPFCVSNETCVFVRDAVRKALVQLGDVQCRGAQSNIGSELIRCVIDTVDLERDFDLLGKPRPPELEQRRLDHVKKMVDQAVALVTDDPLGNFPNEVELTPKHRAAVKFVDREGDGRVSNLEWALGLAEATALLGEGADQHQGTLQAAADAGLRKGLESGKKLCDKVLADGRDQLERLQLYAEGGIAEDIATALVAYCVPKVFVDPESATVPVGQTKQFTARSNTGQTAFSWTAQRGSVTQAGLYTAPADIGIDSVTAALSSKPDVKDTASIDVVRSFSGITGRRTRKLIAAAGCDTSSAVATDGGSSSGSATSAGQSTSVAHASLACGSSTSHSDAQASFSGAMQVDDTGNVLTIKLQSTMAPITQKTGPNPGGTDGIWLLWGSSLDADFTIVKPSSASCTATFNTGPFDPTSESLVISKDGATAIELSHSATSANVGLAAGNYHVSGNVEYKADDEQHTGNDAYDVTCTITAS